MSETKYQIFVRANILVFFLIQKGREEPYFCERDSSRLWKTYIQLGLFLACPLINTFLCKIRDLTRRTKANIRAIK